MQFVVVSLAKRWVQSEHRRLHFKQTGVTVKGDQSSTTYPEVLSNSTGSMRTEFSVTRGDLVRVSHRGYGGNLPRHVSSIVGFRCAGETLP